MLSFTFVTLYIFYMILYLATLAGHVSVLDRLIDVDHIYLNQ